MAGTNELFKELRAIQDGKRSSMHSLKR